MGLMEKREYFKRIDPDEKDLYDKYKKKLANQKFLSNPQVKARTNMDRLDNITRLRKENPDKYKELNKINNRAYRERKKDAKQDEVKEVKEVKKQATKGIKKIINDVVDNIPKESESNKVVKDILNNIIDKIPDEVKKKRASEAVKAHRHRAKLLKIGFTKEEVLKDTPLKPVGRKKVKKN